MSDLPIHKILWAPTNAAHHNHLHVEGSPAKTGTPPLERQPMTPSVKAIYDALTVEFGTPYYFLDTPPAPPNWSHMGWYNRRPIEGTNTWSQHSWSNALDIGPYYGVQGQQKFYDFLTTYGDDDMASPADAMTQGDVNAAVDWNKAFGQMTQDSQRKLMAKLVAMAQNYPEVPSGGGGGIPPGATVSITGPIKLV